jgi:LDH2 family malate/lactate/ureidoglycolate dehydrogenase
MSDDDATLTAGILVQTDMRGIHTHGTVSLRRYIQVMRDGGIDPEAIPEIEEQGRAWARLNAHQAVGMVASHSGMTVAIEKAKQSGIGFTTVRRSNHCGAASAYSILALEHDMVGIAMSNTDVVMGIPGGRGAHIGNNPFSYAVPSRDHDPMVLDIAMSTVAGGKVASAKHRGSPVPDGWLTDGSGLPTTDPNVFTTVGALTPMAGHKGYGLALWVECLAGVLSGAEITSDIRSWAKESEEPCDEGHCFIAVHVAAMMELNEFYDRIDRLISRMKTAPKAEGADRTYVPGEIEYESERLARREGVALTKLAIDNLTGLADDVGLQDSLPFE